MGLPESLPFAVVSTLLGVGAAGAMLSWQILLVLLANTLLQVCATISHRIATAPQDVLQSNSANPIARGEIAFMQARNLRIVFAFLAILLYALCGREVGLIGVLLLLPAILFPSKYPDHGAHPILGYQTRHFVLGALFLTAGYYAQTKGFSLAFASGLCLLLSFSLSAQILLSETGGRRLLSTLPLLLIGTAAAFVYFVTLQVFPSWVLLLVVLLSGIAILSQIKSGTLSNTPAPRFIAIVEGSCAVAFLLHYLLQVIFLFF